MSHERPIPKGLSEMCPFKEDNNHENTEELMILCFPHSFAAFWCFIALTNWHLAFSWDFPNLWGYHKSTRWHDNLAAYIAHLGIKKANKNHKTTNILSYSIIKVVQPNFIFSPLSFLSVSHFDLIAQSLSKSSIRRASLAHTGRKLNLWIVFSQLAMTMASTH